MWFCIFHPLPLLPKELPVPPSEGVQFCHVFSPPSEGAQFCHVFSPPSEGVQFCHVFSPPSEGAQMTLLVIGRLVSEASPAYEPTCFMPQRQGIAAFAAVVEGKRKRETAQKACIRGEGGNALPQRQGIAGFAAVVEGKRKMETAQKTCIRGEGGNALPQRQRIAGFGAVVEGCVVERGGGWGEAGGKGED